MKKIIALLFLFSIVAIAQGRYDSLRVNAGDSVSYWGYAGGNLRNSYLQNRLAAIFIDSTVNATEVKIETAIDTTKIPYSIWTSSGEQAFTIDTTHNWTIILNNNSVEYFRFVFNTALTDTQATFIKYEIRP